MREWLRDQKREDRKAIGGDIKTAQYGWPLGMPLIRKLEPGLWEVRSDIDKGIARVIFTVEVTPSSSFMALLKSRPRCRQQNSKPQKHVLHNCEDQND